MRDKEKFIKIPAWMYHKLWQAPLYEEMTIALIIRKKQVLIKVN
jgi:hypothetical protein